ncbi:MAG: invasion associated locus B family protein [Hyphomicrobiales bacterium]
MLNHRGNSRGRLVKAMLVLLATGLGFQFAGSEARAQTMPLPNQLTDAQKKELIGDGDQMPNVHWFKLCDTIQSVKEGVSADINLCRVHHRALDATTGNLLASATIAKVEGKDNEFLSLTVPLGTAIKAGIRVKIDDDEKPLSMEYSQCSPLGCQGETVLTPEFLAKMRKGKLMFIAVVGGDGKAVGIPIPLIGFSKVYDGQPMDNKKFAQVQNARQLAIVERRAELQKRAGEEKAPAAAPASAPVPAAKKPAPAPEKPKRLE